MKCVLFLTLWDEIDAGTVLARVAEPAVQTPDPGVDHGVCGPGVYAQHASSVRGVFGEEAS